MRYTFLMFLMLAVLGCGRETQQARGQNETQASKLFARADAELILGEPAHIFNDAKTSSDNVLTSNADYIANDTDTVSRRVGVIYCLLQSFPDTVSAQARYTGIYEANAANGVQALGDIGDEGYFHTDGENFLYIMARKGKQVLTMKVNKVTSHTSRSEFDRIARKIVAAM